MKKYIYLAGVGGIILIIASLINYSINNVWNIFSTILIVLGVILCGVYVVIDFNKIRIFFSKRSTVYGSNA
ncbi:hypothetical protein DRQ09_07515, partial [candidate division KSB1 bacterium]